MKYIFNQIVVDCKKANIQEDNYRQAMINIYKLRNIQNIEQVEKLFKIKMLENPNGYTILEVYKILNITNDTKENQIIKDEFKEHMRGHTCEWAPESKKTYLYPVDVAPFILKQLEKKIKKENDRLKKEEIYKEGDHLFMQGMINCYQNDPSVEKLFKIKTP